MTVSKGFMKGELTTALELEKVPGVETGFAEAIGAKVVASTWHSDGAVEGGHGCGGDGTSGGDGDDLAETLARIADDVGWFHRTREQEDRLERDRRRLPVRRAGHRGR